MEKNLHILQVEHIGVILNKTELVAAIAKETKLSKVKSEHALNAFVNQTTKALKNGSRVAFGTFSVAKREARNGRNLQTGNPIKIAAEKVAKFKTGIALAEAVK